MKIIILELNEVPLKILRKYVGTSIKGKFNSDHYQTISMDKGQLSPWITWSTIHRGVTNEKHQLNNINQYSKETDNKYPTIFQNCLDKGLSVGLVNTMHSGILAENKSNKFKFLIPEAFSRDNFCIPKSLKNFQEFNLLMSRASSRIVSTKMPKNLNIFKVIFSYLRNTKRTRAIRSVFKQMLGELFKPHIKVRRRTIQSDLIFDLYMSLLEKHNPDISSFFTNHVASSMHRFWEASFPYEYTKQISSSNWISLYKNEIPLAMKTSREYIDILRKFIDKKKDTQLWIMSSMGQKRVDGYKPQTYFWDIVNMEKYVTSCLNRNVELKVIPQMIPIYAFSSDINTINEFGKFLRETKNLKLRAITEKTISFSINNQQREILFRNHNLSPEGIIKKKIDEMTSSSAYHIPEGFLLRYGPKLKTIKNIFFTEEGFIETHKIKQLIEDTLEIK